MTPQRQEGPLSSMSRQGESRQLDQDRTLAAAHRLEAALSQPAGGRASQWHEDVLSTLIDLESAVAEEHDNARQPDSLLSELPRSHPRLRNRVRAVRLQWQQVRDTVTSLHDELGDLGDDRVDVTDVRQRLEWLLGALRYQRARESDLIYEAYYDAFRRDVEDDS